MGSETPFDGDRARVVESMKLQNRAETATNRANSAEKWAASEHAGRLRAERSAGLWRDRALIAWVFIVGSACSRVWHWPNWYWFPLALLAAGVVVAWDRWADRREQRREGSR
jgi:hypothetical protein